MARLLRILDLLHLALVIAYPVTVGTTARWVVWTASDRADFFVEFRALVIFLPDLIALPLIVLTLVRLLLRGERRVGRAALPGALLLAWAFLGAGWAVSPPLALVAAGKLALGIGVLWSVMHVRTERHDFLTAGLVIIAVFQAGIAVAQTISGGTIGLSALGEIYVSPGGALYRGSGLSVHPNNLAGLLVVAIGACWAARGAGQRLRWSDGVLPLLMVAGLLATGSRAALLALAGTFGVAFLLQQHSYHARSTGLSEPGARERQRSRRRWAAFLLLLLVVGSLGLAAAAGGLPALTERLFALRRFHLRETWEVIMTSPLLGAGAGNLLLAISTRYFETQLLPPVLPAHNVVLMVWSELGLIGLGLAGWFVAVLAAQLRRAPAPFLLILVAVAAISLVDYYWWGDERMRGMLLWWIGLGTAPTFHREITKT